MSADPRDPANHCFRESSPTDACELCGCDAKAHSGCDCDEPRTPTCEFEISPARRSYGRLLIAVLCGAPATHSVDIGGGCTYLCRAHKDECLLSGDHNPDTEYHAIMEDAR